MSNNIFFRVSKLVSTPALSILILLSGILHYNFAQFDYDLVFVQVPDTEISATGQNIFADSYSNRARIVLLPAKATESVILTPEFYAACDPDISFDAKWILYAGKKTKEDSWQIWRMKIDGSAKEQITDLDGDGRMPVHAGNRFYLNDPAPTPQIIFSSSAHGWVNGITKQPIYSLYGTDPDGNVIRRLTFNLNDDIEPDVLPNGRIVFPSWQRSRQGDLSEEKFAFMAVNNDGTDLMPFYGNHQPPVYKQTIHISRNDHRIYIIESDKQYPLGGGNLASLSQRRPLHSYTKITTSDEILFHSPYAMPGGELIASCRKKGSDEVYAIHKINPVTGKRLEMIYKLAGWHSIDTKIIQERQQVKGRSNWLIPGATEGVLYCLDSYRTNLDILTDIERGDIKFVRVIEGFPRTTDLNKFKNPQTTRMNYPLYSSSQRILGIAPVEADGSFQIRVPAEIPIKFQMLNKDFMTVSRQETWIWVMGNENRGCIGCHENRELAPPNILVDAVTKPPVDLTKSADQRRTVDFRVSMAPLVQEKCATGNCHVSTKNNLDLRENQNSADSIPAYEIYQKLVNSKSGNQIVAGSALKSPLMRHFVRSGFDLENSLSGKTGKPQLPRVILSEEEWILLVEWIDLGARWDTHDEFREDSHEPE